MNTTEMDQIEQIEKVDYLPQTVQELESLLAQKEYKPFIRVRNEELSPEIYAGVKKQDGVVSFGSKAISLFEDIVESKKRLPTQREYVIKGLAIYAKYWREHQQSDAKIGGYPFDDGVKLGIMDRLARTYTSRVVELHLVLMLKEKGFKVKTHEMMDRLMGVDIVAEDDAKRYYIHVTTSKYGIAGALKSIARKEERGRQGFARDFSNDCILIYESLIPLGNGSTKWLNGYPLFIDQYIDDYFYLKKKSSKVEAVDAPNSKLDNFVLWAKSKINVDIEFE